MKKFKYLLLIALLAVIACGVFAGCSVGGSGTVDREKYPYRVTYCGNGGLIDGKTERYYFLKEGDHAQNPGTYETLPLPVRVGYTFVGWARGEVDTSTELAEEPLLQSKAKYGTDGGVYMTKDGAVEDKKLSSYNGEYELKFYTYDRNNLWSFSQEVNENIVLVAVWEDVNKFIVARHDPNTADGWEDLSVITNDPNFSEQSEAYPLYKDRLCLTGTDDGKKLMIANVRDAYAKFIAKDASGNIVRTAISFFIDPTLSKSSEIGESIAVSNKVTVVYYDDIEGDFDIVRDAVGLLGALEANRNVYLTRDITLSAAYCRTVDRYAGTASSPVIFRGNGHTVSSSASYNVDQTVCPSDKDNVYGAIFKEIEYAEISDVTFDIEVNFTIQVDPNSGKPSTGTQRDAICYLSAFAASMKHTTLGGEKGVTLNARYIESRSKIPLDIPIWDEENQQYITSVDNEYQVTVQRSGWQAKESVGDDNNISDNSSVSFEDKANEEDAI